MDLHHASNQPDWEYVPEDQRNRWQQIAAQTHGFVTIGNAASVLGALVAFAGLLLVWQGNTFAGIGAMLLGRSVDMFDGLLADVTDTKSLLGAAIDSSLDKLAAFAALIVFTTQGLVPFGVALAIGLLNATIALVSLVARQRFVNLRPSRAGKNASFGFWVVFGLFAFAALTANPEWQQVILLLAYVSFATSMACGLIALYGYCMTAFFRAAERYATLSMFDRYVLVENPASADAYKTRQRISELRELCPESEITIVKTSPSKTEDATHLLNDCADKLGERTLLCVAAGDGTVSSIIDQLLHSRRLPTRTRKTPVLPLWCGNANDLAYMLNGRPTDEPVHKAFKRGRVIAVKPLICTLHLPDSKTQTYTAACYASFGASAFATRELEQTVRGKSPLRRFGVSRLGQEVIAVLWALSRSPTFTVSEEGKERVIFERTHINGSRFAKIIGVPLRLTDGRFHRHVIERKLLHEVLLHIIGLANDRNLHKKTITHDVFTVRDPIWAQFDGEAVHVPAGTMVDIKVGTRPFYALSTRLARVATAS